MLLDQEGLLELVDTQRLSERLIKFPRKFSRAIAKLKTIFIPSFDPRASVNPRIYSSQSTDRGSIPFQLQ